MGWGARFQLRVGHVLRVVLNLDEGALRGWPRAEHTLVACLLDEQEAVVLDERQLAVRWVLHFASRSFGLDHTRQHLVDVNLLAFVLGQAAAIHITDALVRVVDRSQALLVCEQVLDSAAIVSVD